MLHLVYSNRTESLLETLAGHLEEERAERLDPFAPVRVVVPNRHLERYVELGVARALGVAANLRFERLGGVVRRLLGERLLIEEALLARVLAAFHDEELLALPALEPVRRYLRAAGDHAEAIGLRRAQLAVHTARLLEEYGYARGELLEAWARGQRRFATGAHTRHEAWQSELWRWIRAHPASEGWQTLGEASSALRERPAEQGERLHVFGFSYVARGYAEVFDAIAERRPLHLYALNPCEEYWEDVETEPELRRRRRRSKAEPEWLFEGDDPFELSVETETPLLRLWGRPGREHVRLLGALTDCDFTPRFSAAGRSAVAGSRAADGPLFARIETTSVLAQLQDDVLARLPRRATPSAERRDASVAIFACPSLRREVETVAAHLWEVVEAVDSLRWDEIAVLINGADRDAYLPHIASVFGATRAIPHRITDGALAAASPSVDAALALIGLPATALSRPDVLSVLVHPGVCPASVEPREWTELADRLGIFHGLDAHAHEGTYLEGLGHLSWDQGLSRVALGAFIDADEGLVAVGPHRRLPESSAAHDRGAARFAQMARALLGDVAFARGAELSLSEWASFYAAYLRAYLRPADPEDGSEESAQRRTLEAMERLRRLDLRGQRVREPVARELAREALEGLEVGRVDAGRGGVTVGSLLPMRAVPFRVICVLGLGEGRFPAADRRDALDLRAAQRRAGDVTPPERDRYAFLETMLSARERLVLSYVARDPSTGESLQPSIVVSELLEVLDEGYLAGAATRVVHRPPLLRHEADALTASPARSRAAQREAEAAGWGRELSAQVARDPNLAAIPEMLARAPGLGARRLAGDGPLRAALGLLELPRGEPVEGSPAAAAGASASLSLSALRRFLECPLQGWTRAVLRIEEADASSLAARADEPFEASRPETAVVLREAFFAELTGPLPALEVYAARVAEMQAHGRWPLGVLGALGEAEHVAILETWREATQRLGAHDGARTLRFGRFGASAGDDRFAPVSLVTSGGPVELSASSQLLLERGPSGSLERTSLVAQLRARAGLRGRVDATRLALRGFLDHALLAAAGQPSGAHRAALVFGDRAAPSLFSFAPLTAEVARAWLAGLAGELRAGPHAVFFPIEAVLRAKDPTDAGELRAAIEAVRADWGGGQSRFGPVRDALSYPAPDDAVGIVRRRFGLFLASLRAGGAEPR